MSKTLRDQILNRQVPTETATIAGLAVTIQGLTVAGQREFLSRVAAADGSVNRDIFQAELLIATCRDPETGDPLFEDADRDALNAMPAHDVADAIRTAMRLAGWGTVEEAQGN